MTDFNGYEKLRELKAEELQELSLQKLKEIKDVSRKVILQWRNTFGYHVPDDINILHNLIEESDFINFYDKGQGETQHV